KLLWVVALVHVLPPAAVGRLHEDRELQEGEDLLPVHPAHVPERLVLGVRRMVLVRQQHRARHGHVHGLGDEVIEELVVGRPPDRIVDHAHARAGGAFHERPVERDLVADAVEDEVVLEDAVVFDVRDLDGHGQHAIAAARVDRVNQRPGKGVLHAEEQPDSFLAHRAASLSRDRLSAMFRDYGAWHSPSLGRTMEYLWFGKFGRPVLIFPTSGGRFNENEDFHLTDSLSDKVDAGEIQLFCVDSVDNESWYNKSVHPAVRAARHAQFDAYLRNEVIPYIFNRAQRGDLAVYGASFGAYHAADFASRYPDVVSRAICFSGV